MMPNVVFAKDHVCSYVGLWQFRFHLMVVCLQALVWDVLRPNDTIRVAWDILMLTILGYVCIVLPFSVAFNVTMVSRDKLGAAWLSRQVECCLPG